MERVRSVGLAGVVAILLAGLFAAGAAEAANCRKGKPCGGSCIAQNKVCRIGAPTPQLAERPRAVDNPGGPALIDCRWSGRVYRVPAGLCTNGGGFVVGR